MGDDIVIRAEGLGKKYTIGHAAERERYTALRDVMARGAKSLWRKTADLAHGRAIVTGDTVEEFWALKDVSFEVKRGEVLGIIGRNGAGKSTLLKILSRITEPSEGRVAIRGRVASLLEVGTGFHPELTGRENIYLNGAILGMTRAEIRKKFDEIVAFAEVEKFLDTPVKRYSSGMYVRLAFAVAAHLEPEILVVDEVLAVGDAEFQKKCLGKMDDVSRREGRTVLFVSHSMEAVLKLCSAAMLLQEGAILANGPAAPTVDGYLSGNLDGKARICLKEAPRTVGPGRRMRLVGASVISPRQEWSFPHGEPLSFDLWIESGSLGPNAELAIGLHSRRGFEIASWTNACSGRPLATRPGCHGYRIEYVELFLLPGQYYLGVGLRTEAGGDLEDYIAEAAAFEVTVSPRSAEVNGRTFGGVIVPRVRLRQLPDPSEAPRSAHAGVEPPLEA